MESFETIYQRLQPELAGLEESRVEQVKRLKKTFTVFLIITAVCIPIVVADVFYQAFGRYHQFLPAAIAGFVFLVTAIICGVRASNIKKKFKVVFKTEILTKIIHAINPDLSYDYANKIDMAKFKESDIFKQSCDVYNGEDYITGTVDKTHIEMSELHCQYRQTYTDSKGNTQTRYVTFFKGLFMIADFNKEFKGKTIVLPDTMEKTFGWLGKKFQKMNMLRNQLITLEDPEFEKEFAVYGDDQVEARYILSTSLMSRITELKKKLGCKLYLSFVGSSVYIGIHWSKNLFEPNIKKSLMDSSEIEWFYHELNVCFGIVEDLNLNTRIWTKQ